MNAVGASLIPLRRFGEAVEYLQPALSKGRRSNDLWLIAHTLENLGLAFSRLGRPEKAVASLDEALSIFRMLAYPFGQALVLDRLAAAHLSAERFNKAIEAGLEATALHAAVGNQLGEASA
ncbi:tetratricopeptide repeat protein [Streptomyces olivoreticuli]